MERKFEAGMKISEQELIEVGFRVRMDLPSMNLKFFQRLTGETVHGSKHLHRTGCASPEVETIMYNSSDGEIIRYDRGRDTLSDPIYGITGRR
jgi:hypothetical protein